MNKTMTSALAVGAGALLAVGTIAGPAQAGKGSWTKCKNGTFHVLHSGDSVNGVPIRRGHYIIKHQFMGCFASASNLHNFLVHQQTPSDWNVRKGPGKKTYTFSMGTDSSGFEGGFKIKRVKHS
jgi:hypothetical protein